MSPDKILPIAIRPTYSSQSILLTSIRNGASSIRGGGTREMTASNRSFMFVRGPSSLLSANPSFALPYKNGALNWSSSAPSSKNSSKTLSCTHVGLAVSRSILLTTQIVFNPCPSALRKTQRVCA